MKKFSSLLLLQLSFVFILPVSAADEDYRPLLKVGKAWDWYCRAAAYAHEWNRHYAVVGDTIVDGEQCYKVFAEQTDINTGEVVLGGTGVFLEKDRKFFLRQGSTWNMIYNFNMNVGDVVTNGDTFKREVIAVDSITVKGETYRRMIMNDTYIDRYDTICGTTYWVEGIGGMCGMLTTDSWRPYGLPNCLSACYEDGKRIFTGWDFGEIPLSYDWMLRDEDRIWKRARKQSADNGSVVCYEELKLYDTAMWRDTFFSYVYSQGYRAGGENEWSWRPEKFWIRDVDGKIYLLQGEDTPEGTIVDENVSCHLIMDFTLKEGEELRTFNGTDSVTYQVIAVSDTIFENSTDHRLRHCIYVKSDQEPEYDCWVEGIGSLYYGIMGVRNLTSDSTSRLLQCSHNGKTLYAAEDETTGIKETRNPRKSNPAIFDLQGRRILGEPKHGVYIQNGKKVMR